ncbi:zona pellucida-like domain-containing protein 1 [Kryptolebias marmoratus]|uniref:zona pellucida-like domain-containing protein 1 n=1 Tax=Kryptolebias marmoratus TaxID=37003 RepID=UPI0018ACFDEB|nr:zona pellucida-like domain-containing protein 1 [Kryptolebias marmoratus]
MLLVILGCLLGLFLQADAQTPQQCITSDTNRAPENSDITVTCGTQYMDLSIYLCPMYNAQYNESLMVLNNQINNPACYGKADFTTTPPVLKFRFPINDTSSASCANKYVITNEAGTGVFAQFSNVQFVNISGAVTAIDPSAGTITYREQILYFFSCYYPLQYLLNNTDLSVSGVNVAIRDNNGSFISTLSMKLYSDAQYQQTLIIPPTGLNLKTKVYVEVKALNLTEKFHVLLDRCFATTSPLPVQSTYYDLFVGCDHDPQTVVDVNGVSQSARFHFEAFRFVEHKNQTVSTFYLHCTTRLCETATCASLKPVCSKRRKREAQNDDLPTATVTSPAFYVNDNADSSASSSASQVNNHLYLTLVWGIILNGLLSWHEFDSEQIPDLTKDVYIQDIHCVGSLCKLYFRELPNPLLTYQLYEKFSCLGLEIEIFSKPNRTMPQVFSFPVKQDAQYQQTLIIPPTGLNLKTKVYVEVKATNLPEKFHVLLDRCFATTSPLPVQSTYYDLFVGCDHDPQTVVDVNGVSQSAHFHFEAFQFMEHKNLTVSTFYLHCTTRLCETATCASLKPVCNVRRKREADNKSPSATITSGQILVKDTNIASQNSSLSQVSTQLTYSRPIVAIIVCICILTVSIASLAAYFFYMRRKN